MKAIRDKRGQHQYRINGRRYGQLDGDAYVELLSEKLTEETEELQAEITREAGLPLRRDHLMEEAADVLEVTFEICRRLGVSPEELNDARQRKAVEKGGFGEGWVIS